MATELGVAYLSLSASSGTFAKDVRKELGSVESDATKTGNKAGRSLGSGLGRGLKIGTAAVAGMGAAIGVLALKGGITRALAIEGSEAKLTGLGHSAKSVSKIMSNALASVKGTAYGLGDAATVAASLSASGVKQGKELEGVLKTVADTATISGRSLTDVGTIFGSVAAKGKLQGDDMLQLMSSGVPVLQMLATQTGKTTAEVSAMVSKGQIDFKTFAAAMKGGMGGAALASGKTFSGALSNVYAALGRLGAVVAKPALRSLKGIFNDATPAIDTLTAKIGPLVDGVFKRIGPIVDKASKAIAGWVTSMADGDGGISNLTAMLSPLGALFKAMWPTIKALGAQIKTLAQQLGSALAPLLPVIVSALSAVLSAAVPLLPVIGTALTGAI